MDTWGTMCPQSRQRSYHSVALLLPDGRIISAGGQTPDTSQQTLEIFSPPYLFQIDPRPTILTIDGSATAIPEPQPGATLSLGVDLPGGKNGEFRVALVQPSAVTHSTNTGGRYIRIFHDPNFTPMGYGATTIIPVILPSTNNVVPPGYYMITVVSSDGVPSVAKWIKVKKSP